MIITMVTFFFVSNFIAITGIWIVKFPPGHNIMAAIYGFSVLFFGFLPFMVEGGILLSLEKIPQSKITELCKDKTLMEKNSGKNKLLNELMIFAHNYDYQSENILDRMMCTDICPCFYNITHEYNSQNIQTYRSDAYYKYQELSTDVFEHHHRIFSFRGSEQDLKDYNLATNKTWIPFVWSSNR